MANKSFTISLLLVAGLLWPSLMPGHPSAQPVSDRVLSGVELTEEPECALVRVRLNFPVRYVSHFPYESGDELRIRIQPIEFSREQSRALHRRESVRAPKSERAAITEITYEDDDIAGPTLTIFFRHTVAFKVAPGADSRSVIIAIAGREPSEFCLPIESSF